jgi:hypothetical protein
VSKVFEAHGGYIAALVASGQFLVALNVVVVTRMFTLYERRGGRTGEKSVTLILRKNRPVQHTFEI